MGFPCGQVAGSPKRIISFSSTSAEIACSQRAASLWTFSHSRPITSTSRRSARRCRRTTVVANARPLSVRRRLRSPINSVYPASTRRLTVSDTEGAETPRRSTRRARIGSTPSSSSSRIVSRYSSVVSCISAMGKQNPTGSGRWGNLHSPGATAKLCWHSHLESANPPTQDRSIEPSPDRFPRGSQWQSRSLSMKPHAGH
ncbi:unannotated protein [freshwater metagenome]|uniref:Unannotated protein n=1 Tax=freshwater metagenome TaxID=449393 RepID=A0A6J6WZR2_9ZZZZ